MRHRIKEPRVGIRNRIALRRSIRHPKPITSEQAIWNSIRKKYIK